MNKTLGGFLYDSNKRFLQVRARPTRQLADIIGWCWSTTKNHLVLMDTVQKAVLWVILELLNYNWSLLFQFRFTDVVSKCLIMSFEGSLPKISTDTLRQCLWLFSSQISASASAPKMACEMACGLGTAAGGQTAFFKIESFEFQVTRKKRCSSAGKWNIRMRGRPTCIYHLLEMKEADNGYVGKIFICSKKENPCDKILGHPEKERTSVQATRVLFLTKTLRYFTCVFPFSATLYFLSTTFI